MTNFSSLDSMLENSFRQEKVIIDEILFLERLADALCLSKCSDEVKMFVIDSYFEKYF